MDVDDNDYIIVCEAHEPEAHAFFADKDDDYVIICYDTYRCEWHTHIHEGENLW